MLCLELLLFEPQLCYLQVEPFQESIKGVYPIFQRPQDRCHYNI